MTGRRESEVQSGIISYLTFRGDFFFWRANAGAMQKGESYVKYGVPGQADIIGTLAPDGRFIAIEVKREVGGTQSADQIWFQSSVEAHGGLYILARSIEDVQVQLGEVRARIPKVERRKRVIHRG